MSVEIKQKIQDELRLLETELRTEIPQDLKIAVAMGDLSENAGIPPRETARLCASANRELRKRLSDLS